MWRDKQPHGYSRPIICRSYFDLISGYNRPILGRSYADHISGCSRPIIRRSYFHLILGYSRPILGRSYADLIPTLFRVTAGRSYFRTRRNACMTAGKITMAAGKINYSCFKMLSWPHRTSNIIINICFWLLETCTKCSYFIEENMRPGAQRLGFEVKFENIAHRSMNIPWASGSRLGEFPDNRRLMWTRSRSWRLRSRLHHR